MAATTRKIIFTVQSVLRKYIRLTETQWRHIKRRQELYSQLERIRATLSEPDVVYHVPEEDTYHYYRFYRQTPVSGKHMLVIVKHLDGEGFIITCFYTRRISKSEKVPLYESHSQKP